MEDSSYSSDESSDSSNDGIVWDDSEHFDNDFYHQQENKNNALLQDILDSLYDPPIPDNYDIDKPRQIPRNAGTHNRPQCSYTSAVTNEWTNSFPHLRVTGHNIDGFVCLNTPDDVDVIESVPSPVICNKHIPSPTFSLSLEISGKQMIILPKESNEEIICRNGDDESVIAIDYDDDYDIPKKDNIEPQTVLYDEIFTQIEQSILSSLLSLFNPIINTIAVSYSHIQQQTQTSLLGDLTINNSLLSISNTDNNNNINCSNCSNNNNADLGIIGRQIKPIRLQSLSITETLKPTTSNSSTGSSNGITYTNKITNNNNNNKKRLIHPSPIRNRPFTTQHPGNSRLQSLPPVYKPDNIQQSPPPQPQPPSSQQQQQSINPLINPPNPSITPSPHKPYEYISFSGQAVSLRVNNRNIVLPPVPNPPPPTPHKINNHISPVYKPVPVRPTTTSKYNGFGIRPKTTSNHDVYPHRLRNSGFKKY